MADNCKCYSHKVPLRGTFSESPLGPSCEDLRPSMLGRVVLPKGTARHFVTRAAPSPRALRGCMVFNTNRLFEPFYVFGALNL